VTGHEQKAMALTTALIAAGKLLGHDEVAQAYTSLALMAARVEQQASIGNPEEQVCALERVANLYRMDAGNS